MGNTMESAFRNMTATAGAFAFEAFGRHEDAATIREWGAMSDTTRTDHIAGLRKFANHLRENEARPIFAAGLETHTDALAAERDALRAYARRLEREYIVQHGDRTFWSDEEAWQRVAEERAEHGVAEIMDADR